MSDECAKSACVERMLDAALEVFREQGYGASIDAVASRAAVARQTIYNHFACKEALFGAALEKAIATLFSTVQSDDGDLRTRLIRFGRAWRAQVLDPASIQLQRALIAETPRFSELAQQCYELCVVGACRQMAAVFERAMRDGELRQDDPFETARLFMEMLVGLDRWRMLFGGEPPPPRCEQTRVARAVDFFLRAYALAPRKPRRLAAR